MYRSIIFILLAFTVNSSLAQSSWNYTDEKFYFEWDLSQDKAKLENKSGHAMIWSGSLLPSFWIAIKGANHFVKPDIDLSRSSINDTSMLLALNLGQYGRGELSVNARPWGIELSKLIVRWSGTPPAVREMYYGATALTKEQMASVSNDERPFWPDWSSAAFCVPGAKEGPAQSYFRNWDMGNANIALGSFGPSLGAPYGAAFPRPVLWTTMGNDSGWITLGAGSIPDAALTLQVRSGRGFLQYLYREDLWGAGERERIWDQPLRITFGENTWTSMRKYVSSIPNNRTLESTHHKAVWNTWGNWRTQKYAIAPIADMAKKTGAEILVLDDPWESSQGSGLYDQKKFPDFKGDIDRIHQLELQHGLWGTLAWIDDPYAAGLTNNDLIVDRNGIPCKVSWNFDPFAASHYVLDISSERARNFLTERTKKVMREFKPKLLKLDFGYGIPNPHIGVPRNAGLRGERYSYHLTKTIVDAAKSIDPTVTVMYYGISPLYLPLIDMVSLDDQGDLWYDQQAGHAQWSAWASLLSQHQVALNGSSGYDWRSDEYILLNTAVIGSPGSVLPDHINDEPVPDQYINRRYALHKWHRKTIQWEPVWFNSDLGGMETPVQLNCWGRTEMISGRVVLTALVLNGENRSKPGMTLPEGFTWTGRWAIIAQDQHDITRARELAVIPFDAHSSISIPFEKRPEEILRVSYRSEQPYGSWTWKNGVLTIDPDDNFLASTAGFLVKTK